MAEPRRPSRPTRPSGPNRGRPPHRRPLAASPRRLALGRLLLVALLVITGGKLVQVQAFEGDDLAERSEGQRTTKQLLPAVRGTITDRYGTPLAISIEARTLYAQPRRIDADQRKVGKDPKPYKEKMAHAIAQAIGPAVNEREIRDQLFADKTTVLLAQVVEPGVARTIQQQYPEISAEYREVRQYPGGSLAANVLGVANWRADEQKVRGLVGLENYDDNRLAGRDGKRVVDTAGGSDAVIPGSARAVRTPTPGSGLQLTLDSDLQYTVQGLTTDFARRSGAKDASVVVLDSRTAEVLAMANDTTFDPNDLATARPEDLGNPAVSDPFEPGSVNKIITAAAAIEDRVMTPDSVLKVPGEIKVADRTIGDAWKHGLLNMTFTGVLAKSSNVGTLLTAQRVGDARWLQLAQLFGLGEQTGVGLPGESAGRLPPREQWSGSTFANLPIGQGLSMTVLQLAGMYQAIANDGVRIPPRIVTAEIGADGQQEAVDPAEPVRVVSPETARTVRDMLRAVLQDAPGQRGTAPEANLVGYQIAGKTGTAQQVDPRCGCYSNSAYWITFAGILPADDPRYVVAIVLDAPNSAATAAPLFQEIAAYLAQRGQIPLSGGPAPVVPLTLP